MDPTIIAGNSPFAPQEVGSVVLSNVVASMSQNGLYSIHTGGYRGNANGKMDMKRRLINDRYVMALTKSEKGRGG